MSVATLAYGVAGGIVIACLFLLALHTFLRLLTLVLRGALDGGHHAHDMEHTCCIEARERYHDYLDEEEERTGTRMEDQWDK